MPKLIFFYRRRVHAIYVTINDCNLQSAIHSPTENKDGNQNNHLSTKSASNDVYASRNLWSVCHSYNG